MRSTTPYDASSNCNTLKLTSMFPRYAQSWLALVCLLNCMALPIEGVTISRFLGENEELVPGETYQYLPPIQPERMIMYDPTSGHSRSFWRYPVPSVSSVEQASLPTVKRAQFLRIG
ncbi:hypothetical protein EGR_06179 [Echinococcus granulosus]|uniref:Uncharacterized protein n=1 Tax=Echinococcus granulosus TaxID=6210 RepID=W6UCI1_ECHGR|nr:hypothetical protein EGR_06179 [Echinococcus granulosus]EUB58960.1 hypothetical protein EGR_06179 [Echinococcus granulosus]